MVEYKSDKKIQRGKPPRERWRFRGELAVPHMEYIKGKPIPKAALDKPPRRANSSKKDNLRHAYYCVPAHLSFSSHNLLHTDPRNATTSRCVEGGVEVNTTTRQTGEGGGGG